MASTITIEPWLNYWLNQRLPELNGRIFPWGAPQAGGFKGDMPYVLFFETHFMRVGSAKKATGLTRSIQQIDVFSYSSSLAASIAAKITGTLEDPGLDFTRSGITRPGIGTLGIQCAKQYGDGWSEGYEPKHATEQKLFRVCREYEIWFDEKIYPEVS